MIGRVRWHWVVAAVSFAALAALRAADASWPAAGLFAAFALAASFLALHRPAGSGAAPAEAGRAEASRAGAVRRTLEVHRRRLTTWRMTAGAALALTAAGLALFPPLSLVTAAVALLAVARCRRYGRTTRVLTRAADRLPAH
ncbi:hypothetical protein AB0I81_02445 [Nonomuraea sp. NPDC050404]|uniref:hypothetical protein n=1 Tax=Nonomuraea sp. NPDC050404 TaxID=3155783 RepID=UPI0033DB825B